MNFMLILLALASTVEQSNCAIWQPENPIYNVYQKISPKNETAMKLVRFFLPRYVDQSDGTSTGRSSINGIPFDVIYIIDSSWSIGRGKFYQGIRALRQLMSKGRPDTQYAAISFSTKAMLQFNFVRGKQATRLMYRIRYKPGMTNTQAALRLCTEQFFLNRNSGLRKISYKRVLILTDGRSNVEEEKTLYNAYSLKEIGAEIFVIAVGKYLKGISEIAGMASSTNDHLYRVENIGALLEIVTLIPQWKVYPSSSKGNTTKDHKIATPKVTTTS